MGAERPVNPFGWVGDHVKEWVSAEKRRALHLGAVAQGFLEDRKRSPRLNGIYERHQKMDEHVKLVASVMLDDEKRTAHVSAMQELGFKTHKKMDRTIQFWTRAIAIYASYKVCSPLFHCWTSLSIVCSCRSNVEDAGTCF